MRRIGKKAAGAITADELLEKFDPGRHFNAYGECSQAGLRAMSENSARSTAALRLQGALIRKLLIFAEGADIADDARGELLEIFRGLAQATTESCHLLSENLATSSYISANIERFLAKRQARSAGARRWANDPKKATMDAIHKEWRKRKEDALRFTAVSFAREMAKKHQDAVTVEAIKNAQTRWNKEYHPAG